MKFIIKEIYNNKKACKREAIFFLGPKLWAGVQKIELSIQLQAPLIDLYNISYVHAI